ncbi:hypothetical protein GEM_1837 [Burkholderia cepacia GG4]|uniref:Uncharacterized protein n=1 Tax=Burkholderia cepacia GG4 TaxID=1009846 RepID=A0A9W3K3Y0_BURCE|nr:hypothetical protein GEM_1837 [Burkholderia cepacia GG4]
MRTLSAVRSRCVMSSMLAPYRAPINLAEWPAYPTSRHRGQWICGDRSATSALSTQLFPGACASLAEGFGMSCVPPGSALRTQSVLKVSVF